MSYGHQFSSSRRRLQAKRACGNRPGPMQPTTCSLRDMSEDMAPHGRGIATHAVSTEMPLRLHPCKQAQRYALHWRDEGFTKKYRVHLLVYYEMHQTMEAAIRREKQLKEWRRLWKIRLIESMNPEWIDLFDEGTGEVFDGPADLSRQSR